MILENVLIKIRRKLLPSMLYQSDGPLTKCPHSKCPLTDCRTTFCPHFGYGCYSLSHKVIKESHSFKIIVTAQLREAFTRKKQDSFCLPKGGYQTFSVFFLMKASLNLKWVTIGDITSLLTAYRATLVVVKANWQKRRHEIWFFGDYSFVIQTNPVWHVVIEQVWQMSCYVFQ